MLVVVVVTGGDWWFLIIQSNSYQPHFDACALHGMLLQ